MKHYNAVAYHPSLPDARSNGFIEVDSTGLRFVSEDGQHTAHLPFTGLQRKLVGMNNDLPEFRHPDAPDWVVLCQDRDIAHNEHFAAHSDLQRTLARAATSHHSMGRPMKVLCLLFGLFILGLLLLWSARHAITRTIVQVIPVSWEQQLGEIAWEQVKTQETFVEDAELKQQLEAMTSKLLPAASRSGHEFRFHIAANDSLMNAYALPGGNIVVYTGLMKKTKRPEQLAGVLAHEMAHVIRRHSLQNLVSKVGLWVVISTVIGDAGTLAAILSDSSQLILGQSFSRDVETDADDVAWELLTESGIDPRGLREFFELLLIEEKAVMGSLMSGPLNWLSTHPSTDERIQRLREKEAALN